MDIEMKAVWAFDGPLHMGTGLSQAGVADRIVRFDTNGKAHIPGDAVKGAIRGAAERIVRWLVPVAKDEVDAHSIPRHPVLRRLFLEPQPGRAFYRFYPATYWNGGARRTVSSTAIDRATGVAKDETLRTIQSWGPGARFEVTIRGFGGQWDDAGAVEARDLPLLAAALISADLIGGRKGTGHGACRLEAIASSIPVAGLCDADAMERLRQWLTQETENA